MCKVNELRDQTDMADKKPILFCFRCGAEFSANKDDYFNRKPDETLMHCKSPLALVVKKIEYTKANYKKAH